jgi:catechol 2,3-dioxygenase-like lactoylglutathione lyase family enzyme
MTASGLTHDNLFHTGILVADIDQSMAELGSTFGLTWCAVQHRQMQVWRPSLGVTTTDLKFTYSTNGPHHIELVQGQPGTLWDGVADPGLNHHGYWVDDVAATTEHLVANGSELLQAGAAPEDGYGTFTYVKLPSGVIVEPVWNAARPRFERWFAGGALA